MKAWIVLALLVLAATASFSAAAEPSETQLAQLFREIDGLDRPGCSIGVMRDGRLIHASAYGAADLASPAALRTDTVYNVGSISKQFTAFAVLLLEQRGKLSLDDPVRKYIGELGEYANGVTIRHLLHHTGGLRDYVSLLLLEGHRFEQRTTREQALEVLSRQRFANAPPGAEYDYSNTGFFLLGVVVERVSGRSLAQFSTENIFAPLGMRNTAIVDRYPTSIERLARGYSPVGGGFEVDESSWEQSGDGQVHSTIEDLARWEENFLSARVGGRDLLQRLVEPGRLASGKSLPYAAGLALGTYRGLPTIRHGGDWAGYRAHFLRFPEQRFAVAALCNRSDAAASRYTAAMADLYLADLLKARELPPAVRDLSTIEGAVLPSEMPAGIYRNDSTGSYLTLSRGGRRIEIDGDRSGLRRVAERVFELADFGESYVVFLLPQARRPAFIVQQSSPQAYSYELVPPSAPQRVEAFAGAYESDEVHARYALQAHGGMLVLDTGSRRLALKAMAPNEFAGRGLPTAEDNFSIRVDANRNSLLFFTDGIRGLRFERRGRASAGGDASTTDRAR